MAESNRPLIRLSEPAAVNMSDHWFERATTEHFWIRRRFQVIQRTAGDLIRGAKIVAEVGCGVGFVQRQIEDRFGVPVAGFDLNEYALRNSISRLSPLYCYDIRDRAERFRGQFDVVLLLDVLEHVAEEGPFLRALGFHLAAEGSLLVNVPAFQALYSSYDRVMGHVRRYSIRTLRQAAREGGFRVRSYTYWGAPLLPALAARKVALAFLRNDRQIVTAGFGPGSGIWNEALRWWVRCERLPAKRLGASLFAVLEKA